MIEDTDPKDAPEPVEEPLAEEEADATEEREQGGALVRYDPLQRYLSEIRRYPLLSREEEHRLASPVP